MLIILCIKMTTEYNVVENENATTLGHISLYILMQFFSQVGVE